MIASNGGPIGVLGFESSSSTPLQVILYAPDALTTEPIIPKYRLENETTQSTKEHPYCVPGHHPNKGILGYLFNRLFRVVETECMQVQSSWQSFQPVFPGSIQVTWASIVSIEEPMPVPHVLHQRYR